MTQQDMQLLLDWAQKNGDKPLTFVEKQVLKLALNKAGSVNDLIEMALKALKGS